MLVLLPGGTFEMGSDPLVDPAADGSERPRHAVTLAPFFLAKFELTVAQWQHLGGKLRPEVMVRPPTEPQQLSWLEASSVLARCGLTLPTEGTQWEYACRAGSKTIYFTGDLPGSLFGFANVSDRARRRAMDPIGLQPQEQMWFDFDDGAPAETLVGSYQPNAFGLYDMAGNLMEWCRDRLVRRGYRTMTPDPAMACAISCARAGFVRRARRFLVHRRHPRPQRRARARARSGVREPSGVRPARARVRG
ncbi:MAG: formylglycine-generating enzyme family protein [Planctomycetota bacterium]